MARRYRHRSNGRSRKLFLRQIWRTQRTAIARRPPHGHRAAPSRDCPIARDSGTGPGHPPDPLPLSRTPFGGAEEGGPHGAGTACAMPCFLPGRTGTAPWGTQPRPRPAREAPSGSMRLPDRAGRGSRRFSGTPATTSPRPRAQLRITGVSALSGTDSVASSPGGIGPGGTGLCIPDGAERPLTAAGREQACSGPGRSHARAGYGPCRSRPARDLPRDGRFGVAMSGETRDPGPRRQTASYFLRNFEWQDLHES